MQGGRGRTVLGLTAVVLACALVGPVAAQAKIKMDILGWSTNPNADTPEAADGGTIETCPADLNGTKYLWFFFEGKGIKRKTKLTLSISSGPDTLTNPTTFKWPVGKDKKHTDVYGFASMVSFDTTWYGKVLKGEKVLASSQVTVDCF